MPTVTNTPQTEQAAQAPPVGWYVDPAGRHAARYWDGTRWTEYVVDQGRQSIDRPEMSSTVGLIAPQATAAGRTEAGRHGHAGRWIVTVAALLIAFGAVVSTFDTTDTGSPTSDEAASPREQAELSATRAERRTYNLLARSRSTVVSNVAAVREDVAPKGDVPGSIYITAPFGTGSDAGEVAEDNARDATRSIRIAEGRLQKAWSRNSSDRRKLTSAVRTRYTRAYRAQLQYLRDAKAFTTAGAVFLDGWNRLTYLNQRYLVSAKWERYKETSDKASQSRTSARKALTQAHKAFRRSIR